MTSTTASHARARARWRRFIGRIATVGILVAVFIAAAFPPYDPNAIDLTGINSPPSAEHLLGTDGVGRDLLSRLLAAAPLSLAAPIAVALAGMFLGTSLALLTMWSRGAASQVVGRTFDIILAFPAILLAILVVAIAGKGLVPVICALTIAYAPYAYRLVRAEVMNVRTAGYIAALEVQGMPKLILTIRHVLPNISGLLWAQITVNIGYALADVAALSFLGLGTQPPAADWGSMVASGLTGAVNGSPWEVLTAGGAIFAVIITTVLVGDRIEERASARRRA